MASWWSYVQGHLDDRGWTPSDLSRAASINRSIIGRWRVGAKPEVNTARQVARAFNRPLLEVLIAAELITSDEAETQIFVSHDAAELTDKQLVDEIARRLRLATDQELFVDQGRASLEVKQVRHEPAQLHEPSADERAGNDPADQR